MRRSLPLLCSFLVSLASACDSGETDGTDSTGTQTGGNTPIGGGPGDGGAGGQGGEPGTGGMGGAVGGGGGGSACGTPAECAEIWEENASDAFDALVGGDRAALEAFLAAVPKGGDLHNHLSGAVYAETYLDWAQDDGDCINTTTFTAVFSNQCSATNQPVPSSGQFYD
ncbi:MAG: hypothetical protein JNK04_07660, partial [Myxococcales bacterium]|nr:hypothetical protein [Myxococcales bacterium]